MEITVRLYEDVAIFAEAATEYLRSQPAFHNLFLTIVESRLSAPEPGRYWLAFRDHQVIGAALQSPLNFPATVVPMEPETAMAIVDAIADSNLRLPGVNGHAATAASFAGRWTDRYRCGAFPVQGLRLYELKALQQVAPATGSLRQAQPADRERAVAWLNAFSLETHTEANAEKLIDVALSAGRLWLWRDVEAVSVAIASKPIEGVVRVSFVYTPPEKRGRGYAGACVYALSKQLVEAGMRCVLYTELGNPTSNSIYRRIGYQAVMEGMHYRFGD